jgi:hypothetical protein
VREQVREARLGHLRTEARLEHELQHELGVVQRRHAAQAEAHRQLERALSERRRHHPARLLCELLLLRG